MRRFRSIILATALFALLAPLVFPAGPARAQSPPPPIVERGGREFRIAPEADGALDPGAPAPTLPPGPASAAPPAAPGRGTELTLDNMEEALALDESREVAYEGQLYVWRGNELFRRNADGSLALVDSVVETREDETGQKWLTQDSEGNVLIQVSLRVWATINFEYNSAEILSDSEDVLQAFAQALLSPALSDKNLLIAGHTDNIGGDEFNLKLSRARASSVADWLAGVGVSPERLILTAYGSQVPVADNGTPEGQAQNRRVEFVLLPGKSS